MDISLAGRTAVITGSSKGIGLGIALRFAQSGADVAIVARGRDALTQAEKQIREAGGRRVVGAVADVARAGDIQRAYDEIMSKLHHAPRPILYRLRFVLNGDVVARTVAEKILHSISAVANHNKTTAYSGVAQSFDDVL